MIDSPLVKQPGQTKVFGIVDSKFNPQTSIVLINTFNPVLPGVVCTIEDTHLPVLPLKLIAAVGIQVL